MEIILEYTYTGSIKEESLTENNTVEAFYAAVYLQLPELQNVIMKTVRKTNFTPELLSKVSEKKPLTVLDNIFLNFWLKR